MLSDRRSSKRLHEINNTKLSLLTVLVTAGNRQCSSLFVPDIPGKFNKMHWPGHRNQDFEVPD